MLILPSKLRRAWDETLVLGDTMACPLNRVLPCEDLNRQDLNRQDLRRVIKPASPSRRERVTVVIDDRQ